MKPVFKPLVAALSLTFAGTAIPALAETPLFKSADGVVACPEGYRGTTPRSAVEDPFLSPTNAALNPIGYQPPILMGVRNIDHEELINNTTGLIRTAALCDIPIIFSHVAVGLNGHDPMIENLRELASDAAFIDRTNVNAWEEPEVTAIFMEHLFKVDPKSTW